MMCSIWLPYIAHFAIASSLRLVSHVKAPVGWHDTWVCHNALIESHHEIEEEDVIDEKEEHSIEPPQLWSPNQAHEAGVDAQDDTQHSSYEAHAIDPLGGEGTLSLHGGGLWDAGKLQNSAQPAGGGRRKCL